MQPNDARGQTLAEVLPTFRIVTGKGGVGKTVTATSLALAEARRGRRVLVAEFNAGSRITKLLGAKPVGSEMREVLENIHVVDMNVPDGIKEYALLTIKFEAIYNAVFENKVVRHFVDFIPSLGEMVMLGKLWYHTTEMVDGRPRFDCVIVDAPATGHALSMFRTPAAIERVVPAGPMRENATLILELLRAPTTRMHVVALPEEMPVNEALVLEEAARNDLRVKLGFPILNQFSSPLPAGSDALVAGWTEAKPKVRSALEQALGRRARLAEQGQAHWARWPRAAHEPRVICPKLYHRLTLQDLEAWGPLFDAALAAEAGGAA